MEALRRPALLALLLELQGLGAVDRGVAYDPAEVNKEHIGDGVKLGDDPAFARAPDTLRALEDPGCEGAEGWPVYREELAALSWQDGAALALAWMQRRGLMNVSLLDVAAKDCLLGVVAGLHLLARFALEADETWESAAYLFRMLDGYSATIHPSKFDNATADGKLWPVTDNDIGRLRRKLARLSANRTTTEWRNRAGESFVGNAFGALPEDEVEPGVPLAGALKVYVYDVDDYPELQMLASGAGFCHDNQWGFEVALHDWFLACPCRTDDPQEADFFFVPHYTACHLNVETFTEAESDAYFSSLVPNLSFLSRTHGRDHIFVWGGGFGADGPFRSWREHIGQALFLQAEPELWNPYPDIDRPSFDPWKDILVPGRISPKSLAATARVSPPMAERPYTADFVGWNRPLHRSQGGSATDSPRGRLLAMAGEPDLHIRQDVPYAEASRGSLSSKFCFVPRGKSAWSSRLFRVLFAGCVPVLLNDHYEVPFEALLDVTAFLIKWPMRAVDDRLLQLLRALPDTVAEGFAERGKEARCWYVYPPSVLDDEHLTIKKLAEVCPDWRRQNAFMAVVQLLRRKRRRTRTGLAQGSFFFPDGSGAVRRLREDLSLMD